MIINQNKTESSSNESTARLMRILTVTGIFAMVGPDEYSHTPYSMAYIEGHEVDFLKLWYVFMIVSVAYYLLIELLAAMKFLQTHPAFQNTFALSVAATPAA